MNVEIVTEAGDELQAAAEFYAASADRELARVSSLAMASVTLLLKFPQDCSRWRSTTRSVGLKCAASRSAMYTERCWPPVQPSATVR
jgi:hypothetical protein